MELTLVTARPTPEERKGYNRWGRGDPQHSVQDEYAERQVSCIRFFTITQMVSVCSPSGSPPSLT